MEQEKSGVVFCPHCGGDTFVINEGRVKTVRFLDSDDRAGLFYSEEVLDEDGTGFEVVICCKCEHRLGYHSDIMAQLEANFLRRQKIA